MLICLTRWACPRQWLKPARASEMTRFGKDISPRDGNASRRAVGGECGRGNAMQVPQFVTDRESKKWWFSGAFISQAIHPSLLCRLCFPSGVALSSTRSRFIKQQRDWARGYQRSDTPPRNCIIFLRSATLPSTNDDDDDSRDRLIT